jgi:hypothetical protein
MSESTPLPPADEVPHPTSQAEFRAARRRKRWRIGPLTRSPLRFGPAFWTVTGVLSLTVNLVLIILLLALGRQVFAIKQLLENQVIGGLYENFVLMDQAHIRTVIPVNANVPAKFDLPLKTNTVVTLTEATLLENASVIQLTTGGLSIIDAPATILLPEGTQLPVALDLIVPVDQQIPVSLNVNVDIPLSQTDLHQPFVGLQEVVRPYYLMLDELPNDWAEVICGPQPGKFCQTLFR